MAMAWECTQREPLLRGVISYRRPAYGSAGLGAVPLYVDGRCDCASSRNLDLRPLDSERDIGGTACDAETFLCRQKRCCHHGREECPACSAWPLTRVSRSGSISTIHHTPISRSGGATSSDAAGAGWRSVRHCGLPGGSGYVPEAPGWERKTDDCLPMFVYFAIRNESTVWPVSDTCLRRKVLPSMSTTLSECTWETNLSVKPCQLPGSTCCSGL
jgi:hypothetical protein